MLVTCWCAENAHKHKIPQTEILKDPPACVFERFRKKINDYLEIEGEQTDKHAPAEHEHY